MKSCKRAKERKSLYAESTTEKSILKYRSHKDQIHVQKGEIDVEQEILQSLGRDDKAEWKP